MGDEEKPEQTTREIMDKIYAMSPEEFNRFMHEHFARLCRQPLPESPAVRSLEEK